MIEYYNDIPETHHEIGALDYMRFTGAPYLASVHSKLKSHKDNERVHITDEERDKWNHKVDKTTFYELENKVLTKAEKKEIPLRLSQLQNDVPYLTSADINIKLNSENYITKGDLDSKGYITSNDLSRYATKDYVDNRGYLTQSALANYVTQAQFTAAMAAITPSGSSAPVDLSNYYTKYDIDGKLTSYALKSYVDDKIRTAIDSIVIDGDTDITERVVRTWIDEAFDEVAGDILDEVITSAENGTLKDKITTVAGTVADNKISASGLQLAADRAALLVESGIIDEDGNRRVLNNAGFIAAINGDSTEAQIEADKIRLDGTTIAKKIEATDMMLTGKIVATDLEIVNDGNGYNGNGTFDGAVLAEGFSTKENDAVYTGKTETITVGDKTLYFVDGLFIGTQEIKKQETNFTGVADLHPTLTYLYTDMSSFSNLDDHGFTPTEDHTKTIVAIRYKFDNPNNYNVYVNIAHEDGHDGTYTNCIKPGGLDKTTGWMTDTARTRWNASTDNKPTFVKFYIYE